MSDDDNKKKAGAYRFEYATSGRAKCKDESCPKPCGGSGIAKGELRLGTQVDFRGNTSFAWRHWGCVTPQILANVKKTCDAADEIDGFEELKDEDKERVRKAWEEGKVPDEDRTPTARKGSGDENEDEDGEPKKKKRAPRKKKAKKDDDDDDDEKPKKKARKASEKKSPPKKKAAKKKKDDSDSGEDFGEEMDQVSGDEGAGGDDDAEPGKKRKRAAPKKSTTPKKPQAKKVTKNKKAVSEDEAGDDE